MKRLAMMFQIFLLGCSASEPTTKEPAPQREQREHHRETSSNSDARSVCGVSSRQEFEIDGGTLIFTVPEKCDPEWSLKDTGDPAPMEGER